MESLTLVQILGEAVFSPHTRALEKGVNPSVLTPAVGQTGFFSLRKAGNLEVKLWTSNTLLKNWPLTILLTAEELSKYTFLVNKQSWAN